MAIPTAPGPPTEARVSTGNRGLDAMLEGGLVARRPYLVVGPSGTGKTTLALQFLCEGIRNHERVLLVTLEEPPNEARLNHPGLSPELERVDVFDAIPDIMRYERVPFKDIASVRYAQPFASVPFSIRQSPELSSVEVTLAALEQMLRTEVLRKGYSRLAIDSLTALQYFCMKGFDPMGGAQAFLRFLSDLRVTTILTVESPLEDVETSERALARGEIRLFRWEHENKTVRAIGVEKFRGSPHDVRLHPYRIGPKGLDINLELTISRDTRQIIEPALPSFAISTPTPIPLEEVISPVDPLAQEVRDLVLVGADLGTVRTEIEAALGALAAGDMDRSRGHISRATSQVIALSSAIPSTLNPEVQRPMEVEEAYQRIAQRGESARSGLPPTRLPPPRVLEVELEWVLSLIPPAAIPSEVLPTVAIPSTPEKAPAEVAAEEEVVGETPLAAEVGPAPPSVEEPTVAAAPSPEVESAVAPAPSPPAESAVAPAPSSPAKLTETAPGPAPPTYPEPPAIPQPSRQYPAPPEPPSPALAAATSRRAHVPTLVGTAHAAKGPIPSNAEEPRPRLPSLEAASEGPARPSPSRGSTVGPVPAAAEARGRMSHAAAIPSGPRLPHTKTAPSLAAAGEPSPAALAPGAAKRRKKAAAPPRKKASPPPARGEISHPPHAPPAPPPLPGSRATHPAEAPPSQRAKKRSSPRKRRAPTVPVGGAPPVAGSESPSDSHVAGASDPDPDPEEGT